MYVLEVRYGLLVKEANEVTEYKYGARFMEF